jgi:CubicO group peptidase (beta-lactamase class C family)
MGYLGLFALIIFLAAAAHGATVQTKNDGAVADGQSELAQCEAIGLSACPQPFDAVLPIAADMLSWDRRARVVGFRNTYRLYKGDVFHTLGGNVYPLPPAPYKMPRLHYEMDGKRLGLGDYLRRQDVTGLLILKNGLIVHEYYGTGNTDKTLWTSRSVAKSIVSILVGMAIKERLIGSVTDPITRYLPELKGSAWDGVTLRDLLQHTSGVAWNENYADPTSDFARMTRCEAQTDAYQCVSRLISGLQRLPGASPGDVWSYSTGGAWLVGRVLEKATGMTIARYLETHLWSRFSMEHDGVWEALVKDQTDMGGHGFNATLRDWGRFALFVAGGGTLSSGEQLLPPNWIEQSVTWTKAKGSVTPATPDGQYGYQWWFGGVDPRRPGADRAMHTAKQSFWAEGIYGQAIAIDPVEKLVMVQWSAWKEAETPASLYDEQALFFDAIANALKPNGNVTAAHRIAAGDR